MSVRESDCPGKVLSGKVLSRNHLLWEMSCLGNFCLGKWCPENVRYPSKLPLWSVPPSNAWFLGPNRVHISKRSRSVQPFLQGSRLWQTDRQTDHTTPSVTIGRIYTMSQKNVPPMACYNFDTHEQILIFFLAEMLPIK